MPCLAMFGRCSAMQPDTSGMLVILEPEDLKALQWRNFFCADASRKFREDMESASAISWCAEVYFIISCEALILCNHFSSCVCTVCVSSCHRIKMDQTQKKSIKQRFSYSLVCGSSGPVVSWPRVRVRCSGLLLWPLARLLRLAQFRGSLVPSSALSSNIFGPKSRARAHC